MGDYDGNPEALKGVKIKVFEEETLEMDVELGITSPGMIFDWMRRVHLHGELWRNDCLHFYMVELKKGWLDLVALGQET